MGAAFGRPLRACELICITGSKFARALPGRRTKAGGGVGVVARDEGHVLSTSCLASEQAGRVVQRKLYGTPA